MNSSPAIPEPTKRVSAHAHEATRVVAAIGAAVLRPVVAGLTGVDHTVAARQQAGVDRRGGTEVTVAVAVAGRIALTTLVDRFSVHGVVHDASRSVRCAQCAWCSEDLLFRRHVHSMPMPMLMPMPAQSFIRGRDPPTMRELDTRWRSR